MSNELLLFITMAVSFIAVVLCYRWWGKVGLFGWIAFATIVANIEVVKCVDIFGLSLTLGNVLYGSCFLATDVISEVYGGKVSRQAVRLGLFSLVCFTCLTQLSLQFNPNAEDFASPALHTIFGLAPQICAASLVAYLISNTIDTYLFDWIGKHTKHLWIKNNGSTMISQAIDSVVFTFLAFVGTFSLGTMAELALTTYIIKVIIAACDTPFVYICRNIYRKHYAER